MIPGKTYHRVVCEECAGPSEDEYVEGPYPGEPFGMEAEAHDRMNEHKIGTAEIEVVEG